MSQIALLGGEPVVPEPLRPYPSMGGAERDRVLEVLERGELSGFYGTWGDQYHGGPMVRTFEQRWAERFGVAHAISMNSATSGLYAAMAAVGVGPGDEVVVPPWTMSATVMAPLIYGGVPVFADIHGDDFCLDPDRVREVLSPRTRAIIAVDLFGQPARIAELRELADRHGIFLVEDAAQAPLASEHGALAGTVGHIGVYSLNYHKHIHTGEGGVCVTNDDQLATRLRLVRNHAENAVHEAGATTLANMVGFNFRLTELSAAVGIAQLERVDEHVGRRQQLASRLTEACRGLDGLYPPEVRDGCEHVFYIWALRVVEEELGLDRSRFSAALAAEGFPHFLGYVRPLYHLPAFQQRIAIGDGGWPFTLSDIRYDQVDCPVAERSYREVLAFEPCAYLTDEREQALLATALRKVHRHRAELVDATPAGGAGP